MTIKYLRVYVPICVVCVVIHIYLVVEKMFGLSTPVKNRADAP